MKQYAETAVYQKVREPDMKYKIERNTVQETLILPLYTIYSNAVLSAKES